MELAGLDPEEAWQEVLASLPDDSDPPEIGEIDTPAGNCHRIRQRYVQEEGSEQPAGERLG